MANYACVAIGINRYQFLQPLNYGQADARALRHFLVEQANLPSHHCLLLTDTSPLIGDRSTYPNRDNIWRWLEVDGKNSPQNSLNGVSRQWRWFFFSGYGVNWEDVDYLMPIDGNPKDIPGTGIPVRSLLTALQAQGGDHLLVMLDINRSPGLQAGKPAGIQTLELAKQMGIALVLSAQLDQFSHEAPALGNGLFSAALLEALRYYDTDITLGDLYEYLRDRLPELCEHHWRPLQTPLMVIPTAHAKQQPIWPSALNLLTPQENTPIFSGAEISGGGLGLEDFYGEEPPNGAKPPVPNHTISPSRPQSNTALVPTPTTNSNHKPSTPVAMIPYPQEQFYQEDTKKSPWWQQLILWGTGAALVLALLLAAMTLRNRNAFISQQAVDSKTEETTGQGGQEEQGGQGGQGEQGEPSSHSTDISAKASPLSPLSPPSP
ncbi:MAG TPA: hypothetical protein DDZ80_19535, partial [Cyanobacteria bacterium UBA8803]|nr:hypothetical protein [Cyanobacteria bacterium UBA8803]